MTTGNDKGQKEAAAELTPLEKEAKDWEARKKIAEAKKGITQAEIDTLKAQLPSGETKPVEGTIKTDEKSGYAAELAAYDAMRCATKSIAETIENKGGKNIKGILLTDSLDYSGGDVQLVQIEKRLENFKGILERQIDKFKVPEAESIFKVLQDYLKKRLAEEKRAVEKFAPLALLGGIATGVPGVLGAVADVLGYFRMDYEVKGKTITAPDIAFRTMVANQLKCPTYLAGFHSIDSKESPLLKTFDESITRRNRLQLMTAQLGKIVSATKVEKQKPSQEELLCTESNELIKEFDDFGKAITSVAKGNTYSPLANAAIREYINEHLKNKNITHLLYLKITSVGGEQITRKGPFNLLGKIRYLGGCVLTYVLAELNGRIIASDTIFGSSRVFYSLGKNRLSDFTPATKK
jgi:hypothetical protein